MDKNFDFTTMELLMQRLEKEENPELKNIINEITCIRDIEDLVQKQHEWARKYTSPSFVTKNILQ